MEAIGSKPEKTLLVGATTNPERYAYTAAQLFADRGLEFIPIGIKKGLVFGKEILELQSKPELPDIHTVTLYLGPANQKEWMDYLIGLKPMRIIFNPGTENPEFYEKARAAGIEVVPACTLVMIHTNQYL